jgi:Zn-dependent protease
MMVVDACGPDGPGEEDVVSTPVEGGRGLRVRLFGFPVHIDLSFVLMMGLIGWLSGAQNLRDIVLWLVVAAVAVLVHELGHAVVARTTGARPSIALTGFGGLTTYEPPRPLSRARSLLIAIAGPLAGLAVGGLLWFVRSGPGAGLEYGSLGERALTFGLFTTIAWSALNLVPVLPLDGGQAMRELLPGDPATRARRAALTSLVFLVPLFALAVYANQIWLAGFLLFFGLANVQTLRSADPRQAAGPRVTPEQAVVGLLWQGSPVRARQVLESLPPETQIDLAVHGAVLASTDQVEQGLALLNQEAARRPQDQNVVSLIVLTHTLRHDWAAVEGDLTGPRAALVPLTVVERAIQEARAAGRPDVAQRISALPSQ